MINNTLLIKVPTEQTDFTKEGQQQRNCVGHFYHNNIAKGKTFIFFLRRKDSPDKSYITCRYDYFAKNIVEMRYFANENAYDSELVKKITPLIHKELGLV